MTPEKMSELMIREFENMILLTRTGAKEAALIAVSFVIETTYQQPEVFQFWKQVRKCIEQSFDN